MKYEIPISIDTVGSEDFTVLYEIIDFLRKKYFQ